MKMETKALCVTIIIVLVVLFSVSCTREPNEETVRMYIRASNAYAMGQFSEVIQILQNENNFVPALILRAKAEYFSGELERAEQSCRRALRLRPTSFEANFYLARILRDRGDPLGAQTVVESLLADNPQDIRTLRLAAELAFEAGRLDETTILLDRAAEFSAESALVLLDRARLRWIISAGEEMAVQAALDDLNRARAMLPWDTPLVRAIYNLERVIRGMM